jgi:hypothetical protein
MAESEARVILTLDRDFWQIGVQRRVALNECGIVLFRVHPATPDYIEPLVRAFLAADTKWAGHVSTISTDGIQMRATRKS